MKIMRYGHGDLGKLDVYARIDGRHHIFEVKSVECGAFDEALRHALGQLLEYRSQLILDGDR